MAWTIEERDFHNSVKHSLKSIAEEMENDKWDDHYFQLFMHYLNAGSNEETAMNKADETIKKIKQHLHK